MSTRRTSPEPKFTRDQQHQARLKRERRREGHHLIEMNDGRPDDEAQRNTNQDKLATLKLNDELRSQIDHSEGRILLRQADFRRRNGHSKSASLEVPQTKGGIAQQAAAGSGSHQLSDSENDFSGCSTTSDVNSDDDAASIASRLSQIAAEQEDKLRDHPPGGSSAGEGGWLDSARDTRDPASIPHVKSAHNIHILDDALRAAETHKVACNVASQGDTLKGVPMIQVDDAESAVIHLGDQQRQPLKERSKSAVESPHPLEEDEDMDGLDTWWRRDELPSRLPERGNLRELENVRSQAASPGPRIRSRSNTAGSMDKTFVADKNGNLLLNIRRSAWTLSQFDETFNKSSTMPDEELSSSSSESENRARPGSDPTISTIPIGNMSPANIHKPQSDNLLKRASKNALNMSQSINALPAATNSHTTEHVFDNTNPNGRRLSHCHSIVSISSSMESLNKQGRRGGSLLPGNRHINRDDKGPGFGKGPLSSCCNWHTVARYLPIVEWLPRYRLTDLWGDVTAGMAVAVLNISTSLSAAVVAETELSVAFRSSIINTFVFAILCSSRHTSFGSWSIMSQLLVVSVRRALSDELILNRINLGPSAYWEPEEYEMWHLNIIIMYAFLIGLFQLVCGLLNLGNLLASFIPEALCSSMIAATALTMAVGQLANMCGTTNKILFSIERNTTDLWADLKSPPVDITDIFAGSFRWIKQIALLIKHCDQINLACVIISVTSVIFLYLNQLVIQKQLSRLLKRNILVPSEMILLVLAILISYWLDLETVYRVRTCGPIYIDFPSPSIPDLRLVRELWSDSIATALISYTMVYIMAKTYSNKFNYEVDCNQELIACGAGNLIGGLFDALPATGSFSRTAGQVEAGGRTQMASIFNCIILYLVVQLLGHHVAVLPVCVMSAALFFAFVRMMSRMSEVLVYWRICKVDFAIWVVTFMCIITLDLVNGFLYGFIFSILTMLYRAQNRRCYLLGTIGSSDVYVPLAKYPAAYEIDGIKIFQFCGPIHYVCAELFERLLRQKTHVNVKEILRDMGDDSAPEAEPDKRKPNLPTHIILDFSMISYIDSAGIHIIKRLIEDYKRIDVTIFIASLASHVASVVKSEPSLWGAYKERFYVTLADAVHCAVRDQNRAKSSVDTPDVKC